MLRAVKHSQAPILFFQAENDFNLTPSKTLYAAMKAANKPAELHIYPPFGGSAREDHSFPYRGSEVWRDDVLRFLAENCKR